MSIGMVKQELEYRGYTIYAGQHESYVDIYKSIVVDKDHSTFSFSSTGPSIEDVIKHAKKQIDQMHTFRRNWLRDVVESLERARDKRRLTS